MRASMTPLASRSRRGEWPQHWAAPMRCHRPSWRVPWWRSPRAGDREFARVACADELEMVFGARELEDPLDMMRVRHRSQRRLAAQRIFISHPRRPHGSLIEGRAHGREPENPTTGETLTAISDGLVALLKEYHGKTPNPSQDLLPASSSPAQRSCRRQHAPSPISEPATPPRLG